MPRKPIRRKGEIMEVILGLIILIADIVVLLNVLQSSASGGTKLAWAIVIFLLPALGIVIWMLAGPRRRPIAP